MSSSEFAQEARSSVKISTTAKGEATVEVKVYVGEDDETLNTARTQAIREYLATIREVRGSA